MISYLISVVYWAYKQKYNNSNTRYEIKMIRKYLRKVKKPSYVIVVLVIALLIFVKPVTVQSIIPDNIANIEIKYRVDGGVSRRIEIDDFIAFEEILDGYVYSKNLLYSFSMDSWYGDTIKIYFKDSNGGDLRLYVIKHELSGSILVMSSRFDLVYEVVGVMSTFALRLRNVANPERYTTPLCSPHVLCGFKRNACG